MANQLPAWMNPNQRIIRMPVNELDKSTIVSVFPVNIEERNPTLTPGLWKIEKPINDEDFSILTIGPSSWFKEMEYGQPLLEIQVSSARLADSIVNDYRNAMMEVDTSGAYPGIFWIPGEFNKKSILSFVHPITKKSFPTLLQEARDKQRNWFEKLIFQADILWSRSGGNPVALDDMMRIAAKKLGKDKPWLTQQMQVDLVPCKACGSLVNPAYPICGNCKTVINHSRAKELNLTVADVVK